MERPPPPPPLRRVGASADAELFEFGQNILIYVMNTMCCLIIEADKAARSLGEDAIKGQSGSRSAVVTLRLYVTWSRSRYPAPECKSVGEGACCPKSCAHAPRVG